MTSVKKSTYQGAKIYIKPITAEAIKARSVSEENAAKRENRRRIEAIHEQKAIAAYFAL